MFVTRSWARHRESLSEPYRPYPLSHLIRAESNKTKTKKRRVIPRWKREWEFSFSYSDMGFEGFVSIHCVSQRKECEANMRHLQRVGSRHKRSLNLLPILFLRRRNKEEISNQSVNKSFLLYRCRNELMQFLLTIVLCWLVSLFHLSKLRLNIGSEEESWDTEIEKQESTCSFSSLFLFLFVLFSFLSSYLIALTWVS